MWGINRGTMASAVKYMGFQEIMASSRWLGAGMLKGAAYGVGRHATSASMVGRGAIGAVRLSHRMAFGSSAPARSMMRMGSGAFTRGYLGIGVAGFDPRMRAARIGMLAGVGLGAGYMASRR